MKQQEKFEKVVEWDGFLLKVFFVWILFGVGYFIRVFEEFGILRTGGIIESIICFCVGIIFLFSILYLSSEKYWRKIK